MSEIAAAESTATEADYDDSGDATAEVLSFNDSDKGYPEGVPVAQMTDAQRAAYFKDQNRHTDRLRKTLSQFEGTTPDEVRAMREELEALRSARDPERTGDDPGDAIKAAAEKAAAEARAAAEAELRPRLMQAELKSVAAQVIRDSDQLSAFLAVANPEAFTDEDGGIDEDKVMGHLTALFTAAETQHNGNSPVYRSWGQYSGGTPPVRPGEAGKAEAAKRFGY